jgi:hypothetical protein
MPNLDFYALPADRVRIVDFILAQPGWVLYESYSQPGQPLRKFSSSNEMGAILDQIDRHQLLELWAPEHGGDVRVERINLTPEASSALGSDHRFQLAGWGLIRVAFAPLEPARGLSPSFTNHNSEKRAQLQSDTCSKLGSASDWDWKAVSRTSRRLNTSISRLAVSKISVSKTFVVHVLPAAHQAAAEGLRLSPN